MTARTRNMRGLSWRGVVLALMVAAAFLAPVPIYGTSGNLIITTDTILTEDHLGSIFILADGVTLDCDSHTVTGSGSLTGIGLDGRTGVTIRNCNVTNFVFGFNLTRSSGITLEGNTASLNSGNGFILQVSSNNILFDNTANNNVNGFAMFESSENLLEGNTASDNTGFVGFGLFRSANNNRVKSQNSHL